MMVFPNYYQMAVQFTVNPPIPQPDKNQSILADGNGQFASPAMQPKRRTTLADAGRAQMGGQAQCPQISFYNDKVFAPFLEEQF